MSAALRTIRAIGLAAALLPLFASSASAQILDRLRDRAEEVISATVECLANDLECIRQAEEAGHDVTVAEPAPAAPAAAGRAEAGQAPAVVSAGDLDATVTVEVLGTLSGRNPTYRLSVDGAHAAVPGLRGSRQAIVVDGTPGPAFDEVYFETLAFSARGGHFAYVARRGQDCFIVQDGREVHTFRTTECRLVRQHHGQSPPLRFDADGRKLLFAEQRDSGVVFTFGGEAGPPVSPHGIEWTVRGGRVFYIGHASPSVPGARSHVYVDHQPGPAVREVHHLAASDDGAHHVYIATTDEGSHVVVDGVLGPAYRHITSLVLDVRTGDVFYVGQGEEGTVTHVNDVTYPAAQYGTISASAGHDRQSSMLVSAMEYPRACEGDNASGGDFAWRPLHICALPGTTAFAIAVSPDGRHAFRTNEGIVWLDGERSLEYERVGELGFTADGSRFVFLATNGGRSFAVVDGEETGPLTSASNLRFSASGSTFAFQAGEHRDRRWYVNGSAVPGGGALQDIHFSPDGTRYAFAGQVWNGAHFVVVDGEVRQHTLAGFHDPNRVRGPGGQLVSAWAAPSFVFDDSGRRLAYVGRVPDGLVVMLDGEPMGEPSQRVAFTNPTFSPSGEHFAVLRMDSEYYEEPTWTLVVDGRDGPVVGQAIPSHPHAVEFIDEETIRVVAFGGEEIIRTTVRF